MTLAEVRAEIDLMRTVAYDPEACQVIKANLYEAVLKEIAERRYHDTWDLAAAALEAEKVPVKWSACA